MRKTKIVCTLGPATADPGTLDGLIAAGMDAARFNFSHGDLSEHKRMYEMLRGASRKAGKPIATVADLCGPKMRLGRVAGGTCRLEEGNEVRLVWPEAGEGTAQRLYHSYEPLARDVKPGDPVLINDGIVRLEVERIEGFEVICRVRSGGFVGDHKGINLPGTRISTPALTEKDKADLAFAVEMEFDYIALSFVRRAEDVLETKRLACGIPVLAKIEKPEAIENIEAILDAADGVMIARGDLGVELGQEKVPLIQKRIIMDMLPRARPVIIATQMLESMRTNASPTRAEVSDVANAVLDGTDAVMLSGETAVGKHPVKVVETMARIILEVERSGFKNKNLSNPIMKDRSFSSAIAEAVTSAAREFNLKAMAIYTESGRSAALVAAERPDAPVVAFTRHEKVLNRLALHWGVAPLHGDWVKGVEGVVEQAERKLVEHGLAHPGDDIAVTFGMRLGDEPFQTNMLKLWKVRADRSGSLSPRQGLPDGERSDIAQR